MELKYYYIDDDSKTQIDEIAKGLSTSPAKLLVSAFQPTRWEEIVLFIISEQNNFDGLLLDWGLTNANEKGDNANYTVEALAQQIRRLTIENKELKKDFPLVLCSAQFRFREIYNKELSSHDLFDAVFEKDMFSDQMPRIVSELTDLAEGYKYISSHLQYEEIDKSIAKILCVSDLLMIDYRVLDHLQFLVKGKKPVHELARFLLTKLIKVNGPLVDKYILGARLGIDLSNEIPNDWKELAQRFDNAQYKGAFSQAWQKWWMNDIVLWWEKNFSKSLTDLSGPEKVELINHKFQFKFQPAIVTEKSSSIYFWTVCDDSKRPIAIEDGILKTVSIDKASWEDDEYISIDAALEKELSEVHPLERARLENAKNRFAKKRIL